MKQLLKKAYFALASTIVGMGFVAVSALAADTTTVVLPGDMAVDFADVIANPTKWLFYNDESDTLDNTLGTFVNGPATPPAGDGSIQISVTGTQRRNLATYQFSGTALSDISELKFSTYNPSAGNGGSVNRSGYLHFNVDFNGTDTWQRRLVYVPSVNGAVVQNSWQEWDAVDGGNAKWSYSGPTWPVTGEPGTTTKTWSQILTDYSGVRIRVTDSFLGIRVGEPYADGYTENVDLVKFGVGGDSKIFDFEVSQAPSVPVITTPVNNAIVTTSALTKIDWTDSTGGTNPPFEYLYEAFNDAAYTTSIYTSAWLGVSEIPTPGTGPGDYYVRVKARNALGSETDWSNGALSPYKITVIADPLLVGPPTDKNQCKRNGWRVFNNPTFRNQGQCEKYVKDHRDDGKAEGDLRLVNPNQRIKFKLSEEDVSNSNHHKSKRNQVEYWNYEYPGVLHYKADVICVEVDKITKEARFVFQIPEGWPGLTGLYVVAYVKDIKQRGVADLYGHAATADLTTATAWCDTGVGFAPAMYSVVRGKVEVK